MRDLVLAKFGPYLGLSPTDNASVVFAPKDIAPRLIAEKRGKQSVEFLSIWQEKMTYDWDRSKTPAARNGFTMEYTAADKKNIFTVKAVPVFIEYDFWVWSRELDKIQQIVETYMFWQQTAPALVMSYLDKYPLEFYLMIDYASDESPLSQQFETGVYYVKRFPLKIHAWVFETYNMKSIITIFVTSYLRQLDQFGAPHDTFLNRYEITGETPTSS